MDLKIFHLNQLIKFLRKTKIFLLLLVFGFGSEPASKTLFYLRRAQLQFYETGAGRANQMKKMLRFVTFFILFLGTAAEFALAQTTGNIDVSIPNVPPAQNNPGAWVGGFYRFSLMAAGLLAFGMIVYAGLRYTFAAGNPSTQSDARDQILQALLGVLLLLGASVVLYTINPNLTSLSLIPLRPVQGPTSNGADGSTAGGGNPSGGPAGSAGGALSTLSGLSGATSAGLLAQQADKLASASGLGVKLGASLRGVLKSTLNAIINLRKNCSCNTEITSGTDGIHAGGDFSHANGYKVDLRLNPGLNAYIAENFAFIGYRNDGAAMYRSPDGAVYAREMNHWDVLVKQ